MATTFRDALDALRRPLEFVARDSFANLEVVRDLGGSLPTLAQHVTGYLPRDKSAGLSGWARDVARWNVLPRPERERLVAAGLRLCTSASMATPMPRAVAPPPPKPAPDAELGLSSTVFGLPGVGPATYSKLQQKGLGTIYDLLHFLPRRWDDLRSLRPVGQLEVGTLAVTLGTVKKVRVIPAFRRRILEVTFTGEDGVELDSRWFQFRGAMHERFPVGARFIVSGNVRRYKDRVQMIHPETVLIAEGEEGAGRGIRVRYSEIEGIPARLVERLCREVCARFADEIEDGIPDAVRAAMELCTQADALKILHRPDPELSPPELAALNAGEAPPQKRLVFDEFFFLQLGLAKRRGLKRRDEGYVFGGAKVTRAVDRFVKQLPFEPTGAQTRAIAEVQKDVALGHPMHRLLQGDVGSGKTVVAWAACEMACAARMQAAVMAPTEILAEQHLRTLKPWAEKSGRTVHLLTASTPRASRESTLALLDAGKLDVLIGTHALLAERVSFAQLGMVVIDEQHRFGVAQRALLREKGEGRGGHPPHLLVMTATPIPRTLALTVYGDLDVTLLDEMPPGREPAATKVIGGKTSRAKALAKLHAALDEDRQAYWVCPLVEESDKIDLADVTEAAEWLRGELDVPVGLLHGRMNSNDRDQVMKAFRKGELRVLVATTVIEVGVDVPAASVMIIEGAERFGLSQLHQLRGRIGRGGGKSLCLLLAGTRSGDAGDRLAVMEESSDGFVIAEADLRIRGPGEIFGTRQAGLPRLRYADLVRDAELLRLARKEAFALLERDPDFAAPEHAVTKRVLDTRWAEARLFGEEAG